MIIHGGESEILNNNRLRDFGLTEESFFSLPYEYQKAIINAGFDRLDIIKQRDNAKKRRALKQYEFEEKAKEKVLVLLKRNK